MLFSCDASCANIENLAGVLLRTSAACSRPLQASTAFAGFYRRLQALLQSSTGFSDLLQPSTICYRLARASPGILLDSAASYRLLQASLQASTDFHRLLQPVAGCYSLLQASTGFCGLLQASPGFSSPPPGFSWLLQASWRLQPSTGFSWPLQASSGLLQASTGFS